MIYEHEITIETKCTSLGINNATIMLISDSALPDHYGHLQITFAYLLIKIYW